jgi:hypothetical protein
VAKQRAILASFETLEKVDNDARGAAATAPRGRDGPPCSGERATEGTAGGATPEKRKREECTDGQDRQTLQGMASRLGAIM